MRKGAPGGGQLNQNSPELLKSAGQDQDGEGIRRHHLPGRRQGVDSEQLPDGWEVVNRYEFPLRPGRNLQRRHGHHQEINDYAELLTVEFDEGQAGGVQLQAAGRRLELAYAITIHKSQGSEYPAGVMSHAQRPRGCS